MPALWWTCSHILFHLASQLSWRKTGLRAQVQGHICGRGKTETQVSVTAKAVRSWLHKEIYQVKASTKHPGTNPRKQGKTEVLSVGAMSLDSLVLTPG